MYNNIEMFWNDFENNKIYLSLKKKEVNLFLNEFYKRHNEVRELNRMSYFDKTIKDEDYIFIKICNNKSLLSYSQYDYESEYRNLEPITIIEFLHLLPAKNKCRKGIKIIQAFDEEYFTRNSYYLIISKNKYEGNIPCKLKDITYDRMLFSFMSKDCIIEHIEVNIQDYIDGNIIIKQLKPVE